MITILWIITYKTMNISTYISKSSWKNKTKDVLTHKSQIDLKVLKLLWNADRIAIKALFLYLNLCPSVMLESLSCSLTFLSFFTNCLIFIRLIHVYEIASFKKKYPYTFNEMTRLFWSAATWINHEKVTKHSKPVTYLCLVKVKMNISYTDHCCISD